MMRRVKLYHRHLQACMHNQHRLGDQKTNQLALLLVQSGLLRSRAAAALSCLDRESTAKMDGQQ